MVFSHSFVMKSIRDTCIDFFKNEDIKKDVREVIRPIFTMVYNEIYVYLWLICIYHVFFIFIILANSYLLMKILRNSSMRDTYVLSIPAMFSNYG